MILEPAILRIAYDFIRERSLRFELGAASVAPTIVRMACDSIREARP